MGAMSFLRTYTIACVCAFCAQVIHPKDTPLRLCTPSDSDLLITPVILVLTPRFHEYPASSSGLVAVGGIHWHVASKAPACHDAQRIRIKLL
ncbi:hypothetical protein BGW80DRAFT_1394181 [Lactifluus volemus]|nr:hypothetical protein BGW80DRAFT_1394181 [Lactifluus volemus]